MESLAALSLAGNVVQFVEFAGNILSRAHRLHKSTNDVPDALIDIDIICKDLVGITATLSVTAEGPSTSNEQQWSIERSLGSLRSRCCQIGNDLIKSLEKLRVKGSVSRWKALKKAIAAEWQTGKLEGLQERLTAVRFEIHFHLTFVMKYATPWP
jgi:hypothetical protein